MEKSSENGTREPARPDVDPEDDRSRRFRGGNAAAGILLILAGVIFLLIQTNQGFRNWLPYGLGWPLWVVGAGIFIGLVGLINDQPDSLIGAFTVGGIGVLLYWQSGTGNWGSWAYAWTIIPGLSGLGMILAGLLKGNGREMLAGLGQIITSVALFMIFATFLGGPRWFATYWPAGVILVGLWIMLVPHAWRHYRRDNEDRPWRRWDRRWERRWNRDRGRWERRCEPTSTTGVESPERSTDQAKADQSDKEDVK